MSVLGLHDSGVEHQGTSRTWGCTDLKMPTSVFLPLSQNTAGSLNVSTMVGVPFILLRYTGALK